MAFQPQWRHCWWRHELMPQWIELIWIDLKRNDLNGNECEIEKLNGRFMSPFRHCNGIRLVAVGLWNYSIFIFPSFSYLFFFFFLFFFLPFLPFSYLIFSTFLPLPAGSNLAKRIDRPQFIENISTHNSHIFHCSNTNNNKNSINRTQFFFYSFGNSNLNSTENRNWYWNKLFVSLRNQPKISKRLDYFKNN